MTRKDLVDRLYEQGEGAISRARLSELVDQVFEHIAGALIEEGRFNQPGFGTFSVQVRSSRPGRNPKTGETIQLPEASRVHFKQSTKLKARLEG